ncbi:EAL domain-containing protein [Streptomyces sodiiphilus]|uniref:EAL domain-containing protein n=1 Tax=Streptomyces sodiiphilus TaxID=226217 RepID=A0ABN2P678_9ACTN
MQRSRTDCSSLTGTPVQLGLALLCAGYAVGAALGWGSPQLALIMGDFGLSAAALTAAGSCLWYARTRAGEFRPAWTMFGLSSLMIGLGNAVWGWYEVVLGQPVPRTSVADFCFLLFAPLAILGLLMIAKRPAGRAGWACLGLDAWLIAGSLMTLSWSVALTHTAQWQGETVIRAALALAYPLLDIVLVSMVLVLHYRRSSAQRSAINTAVGALALTVLCDALFTSPMLREQYSSGQLLDAGWFAGSVLLACAPWVPGRPGRREPRHARVPTAGIEGHIGRLGRAPLGGSLAALTPYLAAGVCTLSILITTVGGQQPDPVVVLLACTVVLALLLRQGVMLRDNIALTRELAEQENHFRSLVQGSSDVIMIAAPDEVLRYVSPAAAGVYGRPADALIGARLSSLIHPEDLGAVLDELRRFLAASPVRSSETRIECRVRHGAGHWLNIEFSVNRHRDGLILNSRDVTERVRLQAQLQHNASHDTLTDLPNRALFTERVRLALRGRRAADGGVAVFYIDLDGFKEVNDTVGHQAGDELLVQVAQRLRDAVRAGDTTARLGGDEFAALIVADAADGYRGREKQALEIAERVRAELGRPVMVDGAQVRVDASIGIAFSGPGVTPAELLRSADQAMYRAKQAGKARIEIGLLPGRPPRTASGRLPQPTSPGDGAPAGAGRAGGPGPLLHQPVVELADGTIAAVSVQGRRPFGHGLLAEAVAQAGRRHRAGQPVPVAVRVPAARPAEYSLSAACVEDLLARHGLPPQALVIELPDAAVCLASEEVRRGVAELGRLGVVIALDGFGGNGTGVAELDRLPVDLVRLDRRLVDGLLESPRIGRITAGLVRLAAELGVVSWADGVDRPEQASILRAMGCARGQGLALCEPLDSRRLSAVLDRGRCPVPAADSSALSGGRSALLTRHAFGGQPAAEPRVWAPSTHLPLRRQQVGGDGGASPAAPREEPTAPA